ncbi:MAG: tRNA (N(6)-L-threonylcarbamoyladenosine(37)-C(2))-methylthiotransferase MtaB [Rhodospirillaceae bacterium]|nr:tRNA (N(6)-L-threonylcarbamoyladenosine(37)-C(2))-methylthiotransferase MtaB [Rhodospirillaceae bacterium]
MACPMTKTDITTFGCRLNAFESEVMLAHATSAGLKNTHIVNTCAVTAEAGRQARQAIRKLRRDHPQGTIIVSGCAAQINPDSFADMPEVDRVLGNEEKLRADAYLSPAKQAAVQVSDIMQVREIAGHLVSGFESRTRAFVQIQQGCDHRCTFCIIPYGRGNSRSVPLGFLAEQIRGLVAAGHREVVLTGVDISSYGRDLPGSSTLGNMCGRLLAHVPELDRLRLSSLDPAVIDKHLIRLIEHERRLMPHLHLSVQAGSDLVLKRMKRRHTRQDIIDLCRRIREIRPDVVFGADIIVGFPTETADDFQATLDLVDEAGLTYLHVFPYSVREGTPAARMPQLPRALRKQRSALLREKGGATKTTFFDSLIGTKASVLSETSGRGYTEHFAPVKLSSDLEPGQVFDVRITGHADQALSAERWS